MRIRILQQLNGAYGTFAPGHIATTLPDAVAEAWVEAGIAELTTRPRPPVADTPESDDSNLPDDDEAPAPGPSPSKRLPRRLTRQAK